MTTDMTEALSVSNLTLKYGGVTALADVSLFVPRGEIVGLIASPACSAWPSASPRATRF